jgi:hypothetical protein
MPTSVAGPPIRDPRMQADFAGRSGPGPRVPAQSGNTTRLSPHPGSQASSRRRHSPCAERKTYA